MNLQARNTGVDYLRTSITLLVIIHHSVLAYTTFASFNQAVYIRSTNPIVDTQRHIGIDYYQNFNDIYFMSLMFLISGLFLYKSISRKGIKTFIEDRIYRLLIPFFTIGVVFMLLAYLPAYHQATDSWDILAYIIDFFTVQDWPTGPTWYIWVLFVFNLLIALLYKPLRKYNAFIKNFVGVLGATRLGFFIFLFIVGCLSYIPLANIFGAETWVGIGPFDFQISRFLLYFSYLLIGVLVGMSSFSSALFHENSKMVSLWWGWLSTAIIYYILFMYLSKKLGHWVEQEYLATTIAWNLYYCLFILSCTLSSIALLTTCCKWSKHFPKWLTIFTDNAYMMYLIHYIFVVWFQYLFLTFELSAITKSLLVSFLSMLMSLVSSILLRKIPILKKYI